MAEPLLEALEAIAHSEPPSGAWDGWREARRLRDIAQSAIEADIRRDAAPPAPSALTVERLDRGLLREAMQTVAYPGWQSRTNIEAIASVYDRLAALTETEPRP